MSNGPTSARSTAPQRHERMILVSCLWNAGAMPVQGNGSVVQEFYDRWNRGAIDFDQLVREDVTNHQPDADPETGLQRFRQAIAGVMGAVPDSNWTTLNLVECDDMVICHNRWSGTYGGTAFRGIPTPAGNRLARRTYAHLSRGRPPDRRALGGARRPRDAPADRCDHRECLSLIHSARSGPAHPHINMTARIAGTCGRSAPLSDWPSHP